MGDMANDLTEAGEEQWLDHCLGHPNIQDPCPYCEEEKDEIHKKIKT